MNICPNESKSQNISLFKSLALAAFFTALGAVQAKAQLHIIPQPVSAVEKDGSFALKASIAISVDEKSEAVGNYLHQYLWDTYKLDLKVKVYPHVPADAAIKLENSATDTAKGSYSMQVSPKSIAIAGNNEGLFYGYNRSYKL